jgi:hypothetical protein
MTPAVPLHVSALFITLVFGIAFVLLISVQAAGRKSTLLHEVKQKNFLVSVVVMLVWLMFTMIIGFSGFLQDFTSMPPHILLVTLPPLLIILLLFQNPDFIRLQSNLSSFWFIYPQTFRILMEFILWLLYHYRVLPKQMTFEGFNFDILVGLSAPAVAYYCFTKKTWLVKVALVWNIIGVLLLLNIICIAMLSAPYPFRYFMNEPVNRIAFSFPFVWLPSFVVPFAVLLHILSIRRCLGKL